MVTGARSWSLRQDQTFFQQALKTTTPSLSWYCLPNHPCQSAKPVVIVPKQAVKLAVERHTLKRQMRAIIRQTMPKVTYPVVVVVHRSALSKSYQELKAQAETASQQLAAPHV